MLGNDEGFPDPSGKIVNNNAIIYLPLGTTQESIYKQYRDAFLEYTTTRAQCDVQYQAVRPIGLTTFRRYWEKLAKHIQQTQRKTDMCNICHQFILDICRERRFAQWKANLLMLTFQAYLTDALGEWLFYNKSIIQSQKNGTCKLFFKSLTLSL